MALSGPTLTVKSQNYEVSGYETTGHYVTVNNVVGSRVGNVVGSLKMPHFEPP